jgi:hypothetical protein
MCHVRTIYVEASGRMRCTGVSELLIAGAPEHRTNGKRLIGLARENVTASRRPDWPSAAGGQIFL